MNYKVSMVIIVVFILVGFLSFYFSDKLNNIAQNDSNKISQSNEDIIISVDSTKETKEEEYSDAKTFIFDAFHGSTNISSNFQFLYPMNWQNDGQYFSPEKIEYYSLYNVKAPVFFDLIRADIFNDTELKYQIDQSKRKSKDSIVKISGVDFKKYDLIDYGSYGGESAGRVIIYIGPKIIIDAIPYFLVFHWEERPLTVNISGNHPEIFERMVLSLKFFE